MNEEDLEGIARLEGELFGAEAWSRGLLAAELEVSRGPWAERRPADHRHGSSGAQERPGVPDAHRARGHRPMGGVS